MATLGTDTTLQEYAITHLGGVLVPEPSDTPAPQQEVAMAVANITSFGWLIDADAYQAVSKASSSDLAAWYSTVVAALRSAVGDSFKAKRPMYPNFPQQVEESSATVLSLNAFLHYFGSAIGVRIMPHYATEERAESNPIDRKRINATLKSVTAPSLLSSLLNSRAGWGTAEVVTASRLVEIAPEVVTDAYTSTEGMSSHENFSHLWALAARHGASDLQELLSKDLNANRVLRATVAYAGFSPALLPTDRIRFAVALPKPVRRTLLEAINRDPHAEQVMFRNQGLWKRLGERLHPGEYAKRYPHAHEVFQKLWAGGLEGQNSRVEIALALGNAKEASHLLSSNPGEFVRRLDHLLRLEEGAYATDVLDELEKANLSKVSTTVLWQALAHFRTRDAAENDVRAVIPLGGTARVMALPPRPATVDAESLGRVRSILEAKIREAYSLREGFTDQEFFVDPALRKVAVPSALRNAADGLLQLGRGSRFGIGEADYLRLFMFWHDFKGQRTDLDLSVKIFDKHGAELSNCWYGELRAPGLTHSGDITSAPKGAAEYVDIDLTAQGLRNAKWAVMSVHSFTGEPLSEATKDSFAGFMVRNGEAVEAPSRRQQGEVFDARTVAHKFSLNSESSVFLPLAYDFENREILLLDANARMSGPGLNILHSGEATGEIVRLVGNRSFVSVADVLEANIESRGGKVVDEDSISAETQVISIKQGQMDIPMAEILEIWI